jgi:hypothetical protein
MDYLNIFDFSEADTLRISFASISKITSTEGE